MAYAALVSLVQSLQQLLHSDPFPAHYPKPQIESLHGKLRSLQSSLERIFPVPKDIRAAVRDLEAKTRDAVYKAQDTIDRFLSDQTLSSESEEAPGDLQEIIASFDPISEIADSLGRSRPDSQAGDSFFEDAVPSKSTSSSKTTRIVGQEADFKQVTDELVKEVDALQILHIVGMAGIGKTTLAKSIYEDPRIERQFLARAWVTVSPDYRVGDIFSKLLSSLETRGQKSEDSTKNINDRGSQESEGQLALRLHQTLFDTPYLVIIDDMWHLEVWHKIRRQLPDNKNKSRILLTTRGLDLPDYAKPDFRHEMKPLSPGNSWILLCDRVFGSENCPPHLETLGRKISQNCGGLPLSLTVVGGQLSQERKTVDYWKIVEEDINAAAAKGKESYLEILSLSYNHLPGRLKGCFLYMGAFPEDSEILVSKVIKLWVAEGFLTRQAQTHTLEDAAALSVKQLIDRNLVMIRKFSSDGQIKSCGMHDVLRDMSLQECRKEKFFHGIKKFFEELPDDTVDQRRLSVHKNILMCMEEVYNFVKSIKPARTLLYAGPHHHHPFPFSIDFDLLRVLDALTVYFIEFPNEVLKLIHLRYLSLTYNGKLPSSVSKLHNLQVLIVRQHPKVIFVDTSILPAEIWSMPQLRHLLFTESNLPGISSAEFLAQDSVFLENLQSLTNVNIVGCRKEVLGKFPNLKKLGMWVEAPGDVYFHVDQLGQLETFKFTVLKPIPGSKVNFLPELVFPKTLRKLSLSGCGIPWEDMTIIGQLDRLEVLKLREFAFQGQEWFSNDEEFRELKYLLLEAMDLEYWEADSSHFPSLEKLIIRHCYELEGIPTEIGDIGGLELIEMVDCSPEAVESAREIREQQEGMKKGFQVRIYSSWE